MDDYEIRYLNSRGTVALLQVTNCASDDHAREQALKLFNESFHSYEVWHGHECVQRGAHTPDEAVKA